MSIETKQLSDKLVTKLRELSEKPDGWGDIRMIEPADARSILAAIAPSDAAQAPIYQNKLRRADSWCDCDKETFDHTSKHPQRFDVRVLYAAPVAPQAAGDAAQAALTAAARDVLAERERQVSEKGWTPEHDDAHACDEIAAFAAIYAMPEGARDWPTEETGYGATLSEALTPDGWQPKFGDRRRDLIKAGALILAEIDRIDRAVGNA